MYRQPISRVQRITRNFFYKAQFSERELRTIPEAIGKIVNHIMFKPPLLIIRWVVSRFRCKLIEPAHMCKIRL